MATPQSSASDEVSSGTKSLEQITFRFCSECSNMLYPKEDEDSHKLQYTCRTCQYTEEATSSCVFRNVLNSSSGETAGVTQDVGSDPTVSNDFAFCTSCGDFLCCRLCGVSFPCLSPDPEPSEYEMYDYKSLSAGALTEEDAFAQLRDPLSALLCDPDFYDDKFDDASMTSDDEPWSDTDESCVTAESDPCSECFPFKL